MSFRRQLVGAALVSLVALAAAGCGGGSASAQETWADDVCTSVGDWKTELESIRDDVQTAVQSPSAETVPAVRSAVDRGSGATQTLVDELRQAGAPPGDNGAQARDIVQEVADNLRKAVDTAKAELAKVEGEGLSQAITALGVVGTQLSAAVAQAQSAYDSLVALGGDLKKGIEDADSCDSLRGD